MIFSFFESVKYVGHLLPMSFLRIFMGYFYLQQALNHFRGDFLVRPRLAEMVAEWLPLSHAPNWYKMLITLQVIPHWKVFAFILMTIEFAVAVSYIVGYVVRPTAILAAFISFNMIFISGPINEDLFKVFIAIHLCLGWLGAGRCLGMDYYFFKRRRGIWW